MLLAVNVLWWLQILHWRNSGKIFLNVEGTAVFMYTSTLVNSLEIPMSLCLYVIYMYMYVHIWIFDTVWWIMIYSKLSCDLRDKHRCKWFLICVFLMVMNFLKLLMLFYSFVISSSRSDWSRSDCLDVVFSLNSWFWK